MPVSVSTCGESPSDPATDVGLDCSEVGQYIIVYDYRDNSLQSQSLTVTLVGPEGNISMLRATLFGQSVFVPTKVLRYKATYTATATAPDGKSKTWSFNTEARSDNVSTSAPRKLVFGSKTLPKNRKYTLILNVESEFGTAKLAHSNEKYRAALYPPGVKESLRVNFTARDYKKLDEYSYGFAKTVSMSKFGVWKVCAEYGFDPDSELSAGTNCTKTTVVRNTKPLQVYIGIAEKKAKILSVSMEVKSAGIPVDNLTAYYRIKGTKHWYRLVNKKDTYEYYTRSIRGLAHNKKIEVKVVSVHGNPRIVQAIVYDYRYLY